MSHWVAGLGCRRECRIEPLRSLLDTALERAAIERRNLTALATIDAKQDEPALRQLAQELGLELRAWPAPALRAFEHRLTSRSERAFAQFGCHGIAEAAALATAEANGRESELAVPRMTNGQATIALARYPI
ncbi:MAG: cobalamin biosynthesis protein [Halofilum sp. (in: g-proteobacteria)]